MSLDKVSYLTVLLGLFLAFSLILTFGCAKGQQGPPGTTVGIPVEAPVYIGCYVDSSSRALPNFLMSTGATLETCVAMAKTDGFAFAGLQDGVQCFAGNDVGHNPALESDCSIPCVANTAEICGGAWRNSIYFTGVNPQ